MHRRNEMEAAHLERKQIPKITHLKEVAVGDNGEMFGDNMVAQPRHGQKPLDQIGIHDNLFESSLGLLIFGPRCRQDSSQKIKNFP